ncbi:MAG: hypothetical protein GXO10_05655 [Crenarchaeota archaeon]|nr:hypothetical protein [Thermoproteota archaeon]
MIELLQRVSENDHCTILGVEVAELPESEYKECIVDKNGVLPFLEYVCCADFDLCYIIYMIERRDIESSTYYVDLVKKYENILDVSPPSDLRRQLKLAVERALDISLDIGLLKAEWEKNIIDNNVEYRRVFRPASELLGSVIISDKSKKDSEKIRKLKVRNFLMKIVLPYVTHISPIIDRDHLYITLKLRHYAACRNEIPVRYMTIVPIINPVLVIRRTGQDEICNNIRNLRFRFCRIVHNKGQYRTDICRDCIIFNLSYYAALSFLTFLTDILGSLIQVEHVEIDFPKLSIYIRDLLRDIENNYKNVIKREDNKIKLDYKNNVLTLSLICNVLSSFFRNCIYTPNLIGYQPRKMITICDTDPERLVSILSDLGSPELSLLIDELRDNGVIKNLEQFKIRISIETDERYLSSIVDRDVLNYVNEIENIIRSSIYDIISHYGICMTVGMVRRGYIILKHIINKYRDIREILESNLSNVGTVLNDIGFSILLSDEEFIELVKKINKHCVKSSINVLVFDDIIHTGEKIAKFFDKVISEDISKIDYVHFYVLSLYIDDECKKVLNDLRRRGVLVDFFEIEQFKNLVPLADIASHDVS